MRIIHTWSSNWLHKETKQNHFLVIVIRPTTSWGLNTLVNHYTSHINNVKWFHFLLSFTFKIPESGPQIVTPSTVIIKLNPQTLAYTQHNDLSIEQELIKLSLSHHSILYRPSTFSFSSTSASGIAPADAARGEQEPIHEDALAVIIRIVGQQPVPFVLLFTATIASAAIRMTLAVKN